MSSSDRKLGFAVCFASGEDPDYPATELNYHSPQTKGWQSPRFCEYPQEVGLQFLDGAVNISQVQLLSHQHKIATRIELFTGVGTDYLNCQFTRLGYLSLDSNERSQYKARELKSVYLKAKGSFLKLLMHKCYLNPLNLFSQVGLIAINVLGQPANMGQPGAPLGLRGAARAPSGPSGAGINDLAVDMGMDADTAAMLREVALRKEAAVAGEDFELAKRLKALQDQIKHVGGTLAALTADKARAVEQEDYDTAARLKDEIGRIRGVILSQMGDLGIRPPPGVQMGQAPHYAPPMHQYQQQQQQPALMAPPPGYDRGYPSDGGSGNGGGPTLRESIAQGGGMPGSVDRPIRPAAAGSDIYARAAGTPERVNAGEAFGGRRGSGAGITSPGGLRQQLAASFDAQGRPVSRQIRPARDDNVEAKLQEENARRGDGGGGSGKESDSSPFTKRPGGGGGEERPDASQLAGVEGAGELPAPDSLPTALEKEAQPVTDLFGGQSDYVARCLYSRAWSLREAAVLKIAHDVEAGWPMERHGRGKGEVLATCAGVLSSCITKDRIANVFIACASKLLPVMLTSLAKGHDAVRKQELATTLEPVIAALVDKMGDNTPKVRETAMAAIVELSSPEYLGPHHVTHNFLLRKPSKKQAGNLRGLQSRLETLSILVDTRKLVAQGGGTSADVLVGYCQDNRTFEHANGDIRRCTLELMTACYKATGPALEAMLQPLLRPKQMDEYRAAFAAATGGRAPAPQQHQQPQQAAPGKAGHGKQQAAAKAGAGAAGSSPPSGKQQQQGKKGGKAGGGTSAPAPMPPVPESDHDHDLEHDGGEVGDGVCQFCGGCGPGATEQQLDLHYWQDCPMLMSCPRCQQVIEIATLQEHMLDECEHKGDYEPCPTCGDAVPAADLEAHVAANTCKPMPDPSVSQRCPLCKGDIGPDKDGWLQHLLDQGCPANNRSSKK